jgi:FADH2 O2-dependent halogenase
VQAVQNQQLDPETAAREIFEMLQRADFIPPAFYFTDRANRWPSATGVNVLKTLAWAKNEAPPEIGGLVYEGLTLFIRKRLSPDEFNLLEEIKHAVAGLPVLGRALRVPTPH